MLYFGLHVPTQDRQRPHYGMDADSKRVGLRLEVRFRQKSSTLSTCVVKPPVMNRIYCFTVMQN